MMPLKTPVSGLFVRARTLALALRRRMRRIVLTEPARSNVSPSGHADLSHSIRSFLTGASSYSLSEALHAAQELGLLPRLAERRYSAPELAQALQLDLDGCQRLLDLLVASQLLERHETGFEGTPLLKWCSDSDGLDSLAAWLSSCREFHGLWRSLPSRLMLRAKKMAGSPPTKNS